MLTRRLLPLLVPAWIITLAIAVSAQAPPASTSSNASDSNLLTNKSAIEMVAPKLRQEVVITKIQTSNTNFDLLNPASVERNNSGVPASAVEEMMMPKNAPPRRGSHKSLIEEGT